MITAGDYGSRLSLAFARVGRDDDRFSLGRTNLRLWETIVGSDPLFPDCYLQ